MNTPSLSPRETLSDDQLTMLKNWVAFYAKNDIYIDLNNPQLGNNLAAVPDTTQGEPPKIMVNAQLVMEKFNLSPSEFLVVLFHEIEHLFEDAELKSSLEGKSVIIERKQRQKAHGNLAGSYHFLENVLRDMFVNERVVSMDKVPVLRDNMHDLYQKKLFATKDYREKPLHQQFCNALLREHFVPEEECQVHPKVRKLLRRMVKSGIIDKTTAGSLEERLKAMWKLVEPTFTKLLEEDIKNQQIPEKKTGEQQGEHGEQQGEHGEQQGESGEQQGEHGEQQGESGEQQGEHGEQQGESGEQQGETGEQQGETGEQQGDLSSGTQSNPFEKYYQNKLPHFFDDALSPEEREKLAESIKQQVEKKQEAAKEQLKTPEQKELEQRVKRLLQQEGTSPDSSNYTDLFHQTLEQLTTYQNFVRQLETIKDTQTGKSVMEELLHLFDKIKSTRMKRKFVPKYPINSDYGVKLHGPSLAQGIADYHSGNPYPEMFEIDSFREKRAKNVGNFEVMIIGDGSYSMKGDKNREQKKAILLVFEALKNLHDRIALQKERMESLVSFETEGYLFSGNLPDGHILLKPKGSDFSDRERLDAYTKLGYAGGDTPDRKALSDTYTEWMTDTHALERKEIQTGKRKKLIFVFSDGESNEASRLKAAIDRWRQQGVYVYGVGIGDEADVSHYLTNAPKQGGGEICSSPEQLAQVMKNLLSDIIT